MLSMLFSFNNKTLMTIRFAQKMTKDFFLRGGRGGGELYANVVSLYSGELVFILLLL